MYIVKPTTKFQKDLKRAEKRGYDIDLLTEVIKKLAAGETLDASYNEVKRYFGFFFKWELLQRQPLADFTYSAAMCLAARRANVAVRPAAQPVMLLK